jgi:outer membrane protein OmpA-like peptidoglycan-associated protein
VVSGGHPLVLRTPFDVFVLRFSLLGASARTPAESGRRFIRELRLGLEHRDPAALGFLAELSAELGGDFSSSVVQLAAGPVIDSLLAQVDSALVSGRLVVEASSVPSLTERRDLRIPELPPLPRAAPEASTRTFEVRFVDELGKAIGGIAAEFSADGPQTRSTNPAGVALLEGVESSSATVSILDVEGLDELLESRWEKLRPGTLAKESNTTEVVFRRAELGPFALKAELPNRIVIKPPLAKLSVQLFDKTGRVPHAQRPFSISGPQAIEGTTDEEGRIEVPDVLQGDYTLSLTVESFKGDSDETVEVVESPLVALDLVAEPQVRMVAAVPISILARLHMFFNTNKAFLLPTALASMQKLRRLYIENAPCKLLAVGHADTKGGAAFNDKLSLARARATIAYL